LEFLIVVLLACGSVAVGLAIGARLRNRRRR
jgi:hypothetical protein